jgi:hypothetical protein
MIAAVWLLSLPFRLLAALGLRRSVILACLSVLVVTAYGVAEDLGLLEPPAQAAPVRNPAARQPAPSRAAAADIPAGYLRLYRTAGAHYRIPWPVLAAIGKVESDHGRSPLPGVRSGSNWPAATAPEGVGGGERPDRPPPGHGPGLDQAADRGLLRGLRHRAGPPPQPGPGHPSRPSPALPGLRHPHRPQVARHHQPG